MLLRAVGKALLGGQPTTPLLFVEDVLLRNPLSAGAVLRLFLELKKKKNPHTKQSKKKKERKPNPETINNLK